MTFAFFWVLFAIAVGVLASNRGRSGLGWFALSLLISPLLGLLFCAVAKNLANEATTPGAATHVACPACAEWVLPQAKVCKHCAAQLSPQTAMAAHQAERNAQDDDKSRASLIFWGLLAALALGAYLLAGRT